MARLGGFALTVRHLFIVVPVAGLAWAVTSPFTDNSFLWHVRAGTLQLDRGRVLSSDPFSMEYSGEPWRTQSWLADLGYGALERATGGIEWVPFFMFAVAAGTISLVLATTFRRSSHLGVTAAAGLLLVWQAVPFANARPVVLSYLLLAAVAAALHSGRVDWVLPGIIWLWAMVHGSFVVGIGLVVLVAVHTRSRRRFELAAIATVLATLTAHGIGVWEVLIRFLTNRDALELIQEWRPPDYTHPLMIPGALLLMGAIVAAARGRLPTRDLIVVIPFLLFGMLAVRNLYPAMIVVLPYVALGFVPEGSERRRAESPLFAGAVLAAVAVLAVMGLSRPFELSQRHFPPPPAVAAIEPGPLFHGIASGGYLIYAEWPEREVLVDDRAELFGFDGFTRYLDVADARGWRELFAELDISQALLDPDWPLTAALADAGWIERYRGDDFVVVGESRSGP